MGASGYSVSSDGQVRRDARRYNYLPGPVTVSMASNGYPSCTITFDDGKSRKTAVHSLVACAFIGPCPDRQMVRHWDGNPSNNCVDNLLYGTSTDNVADAIRHGRQVRGARQHLAKLNDAAVAEIVNLLTSGVFGTTLAQRFGVTTATISQIRRGVTWTHIARPGPSGRMQRVWRAV